MKKLSLEILWAEFEKKYCNNYCNSNSIWQFSIKYSVDDEILREFAQKLKGRVDYYDDGTADYVRYNLVPDNARSPREGDLEAIEKFIEFSGDNLLAGAILAIYRIRNNLLHGLKVLDELNGQIELFKAMNKVLENIKLK